MSFINFDFMGIHLSYQFVQFVQRDYHCIDVAFELTCDTTPMNIRGGRGNPVKITKLVNFDKCGSFNVSNMGRVAP